MSLFGAGFPAEVAVRLGGVACEVTASAPGAAVVIVPRAASNGRFRLDTEAAAAWSSNEFTVPPTVTIDPPAQDVPAVDPGEAR